ncbi:UrcA family protein [Sphingomonas vulcanisoli]|nr:UrcA family protein [Sphingomonas vulcanisoli]
MRSLILPAALLLSAAPAFAQTHDETVVTSNHSAGTTTRTVAISTRGLNLGDGRDFARLQRRVAAAADSVCTKDGLWNKFDQIEYSRCRDNAVASAMAHLPATGAATN